MKGKMIEELLNIGLYTTGFVFGSELVWRYIWKRRISQIINTVQKKDEYDGHFSDIFSVSIIFKHVCDDKFCEIKNLEKICEIIDNAKSSIDIAMYMFYCKSFLSPLLKAHDRGVSIRIFASRNEIHKQVSTIEELDSKGVSVRYYFVSPKLMHHKFCVVDANLSDDEVKDENEDEKPISRVLFIGSQNWTERSFYINCDNYIIKSNIKLIKKYRAEFDRLWAILDPKPKTNELQQRAITRKRR